MSGGKNKKLNIWVYAVILFTSAFVVLLLTAMSQIKFNRYINDYRNQITTKESEKNKFKSNLNIALEENARLESEIQSLKEEMENLNDDFEEIKEESEKIKAEYERTMHIYKVLVSAQNLYDKGNYTECAELLYKEAIDVNSLDAAAKERYQFLVDRTFKKASLEFYRKGYAYFKEGLYDAAEKRFLKSIGLADSEYYSDDCYYYLAYIKYKTGDKRAAASYIEALLTKYPKSTYTKAAKELLKLMEK